MKLEKYSFGIGDRFGCQGQAQLNALIKAKTNGINIVPVWNKSHREHTIIGTCPADVRTEADTAVDNLKWDSSYYVDADHINLDNVDLFMDSSDFFTLDVADYIGIAPEQQQVDDFVQNCSRYIGQLNIPGIEDTLEITDECIIDASHKFLVAVGHASKIYCRIESIKGKDNFITEVSMDESEEPQTPVELFFILAMIAQHGVPTQTIAPKFTGRFNKGVDYVGDVDKFEKEFNENIAVINFAVKEFNLPESLKLSIHSGSDKFSIYDPISRALKKFDAGLHIKTAGTTWLEELIGLAEAGSDGLEIAKEIYTKAFSRFDELCGPYAPVIDIDTSKLPAPSEVQNWTSSQYSEALRHDLSCPEYNLNFRQLMHVAYKVAAQMGDKYINALNKHERKIAKNVTKNIYERHIKPLFLP